MDNTDTNIQLSSNDEMLIYQSQDGTIKVDVLFQDETVETRRATSLRYDPITDNKMDRFQNKYRIPSARANWHGYDGGVYFVTICTKNREHYFGEICRNAARHVSAVAGTNTEMAEPQMQLSPIGQYAHEQFVNVKTHYPYAEIPLFVVMPNHIHAIVIIDGENETINDGTDGDRCCRDGVHTVSTGGWKTITVMANRTMC